MKTDMQSIRRGIIQSLDSFIYCPCCEGQMECKKGCTFADDCPEDAENLKKMRDAINKWLPEEKK